MDKKKNCKEYTRPQPLLYGPGPKYRNIPLPPHDCHSHFNPDFDKNDCHAHHHNECRPGIIPPPPFMVDNCHRPIPDEPCHRPIPDKPCHRPIPDEPCHRPIPDEPCHRPIPDKPCHRPIPDEPCHRPIPDKPCHRPIPDEPCHRPAFRPNMNHKHHRQKYFYTVLFLDNYYDKPDTNRPIMPNIRPNGGQLKSWDICEDTETSNIHWLDNNRLYVRHNLQMPITLEMWDHEKNTIVYCPILKQGVCNVTMGDVEVDSERSIIINFSTDQKPKYNQVYHLAIRSLPDFALTPDEDDCVNKPLKNLIEMPKYKSGLALIFRRNSLDGLYDLIAEFDDTYYHSLDDNSDLQYLTDKSCYKDVHFVTKYTNNLQDVLDLIDVGYYKIEYSWEDHKKYRQF